jgi:hypothetical protein
MPGLSALFDKAYAESADGMRAFVNDESIKSGKKGWMDLAYSVEHRYEERDGDYHLKSWHDHGANEVHGPVAHRPDWLTNIIDMAKIGGHCHEIRQPPPDLIVWFGTDDKNQLVKFIEMT